MKKLIASLIAVSMMFMTTVATAEIPLTSNSPLVKKCFVCHGKDGISKSQVIPNLAGQKAKYMVNQMTAFKKGRRKNPMMKISVKKLSKADMKKIALFFSVIGMGTTKTELISN